MEEIILRNSPKLKFVFNDKGFEIIDAQDSESNSGSYLFKDLEKSEFIKKQTDWLVTILSFFTGFGGSFKNQAYIKLFFKSKSTLKIWLNAVDIAQIELLEKRLYIKKPLI